MQRIGQRIRIFAVAVTVAGGVQLSVTSDAHAMEACSQVQWLIAECGFNTDCAGTFEPFGCGTVDTCWYDPVEDMVHYEGSCWPSEELCTTFFC